jgi:hypothetical protein
MFVRDCHKKAITKNGRLMACWVRDRALACPRAALRRGCLPSTWNLQVVAVLQGFS